MFSIFVTDDFNSPTLEFEVHPKMVKMGNKVANKKKLTKIVLGLLIRHQFGCQ